MTGYLKMIGKAFYQEEEANVLVETLIVFAGIAIFITALTPILKEKVRNIYTEEPDDFVFDGEQYDSLIN